MQLKGCLGPEVYKKSVFMSMPVSDESYLNKRMTHIAYLELTWLQLAIVAYRVAAKISHWLKVHVCVCSKNAPLENYARGLIN